MRLIRLLKKDLATEMSTWVAADLLSLDQARNICRLYDIDYDSIQSRSFAYALLVTLGYLFVGLALITLLGANWDQIPRGLRMTGLVAVTLGIHGLALRSYANGNEARATGLFLLGNVFYGAAIILIAQIYHLGEHMPDGIFWWALGSLPFGVLLRNTWLTVFSCLLALLWFFLEYSLGFFPALLPIFIAAGIYVLVRGRPSVLLLLTVVASAGLWIEAALSALWAGPHHALELHAEQAVVSVALFVLAYAVSHWMYARHSSKAKDYGTVLSLWTLRFALLLMFVLSYEQPWIELIRTRWSHQSSMWLIVAALFAVSLWLGWRSRKLTTVLPIVVVSTVLIAAAVYLTDTGYAIYLQVAVNLALIAAGIALIVRGIDSGISHYFFLGVASILITAFMRYTDLIGDYIGGALLFMVFAALLLGAAKYWKKQRRSEARSG